MKKKLFIQSIYSAPYRAGVFRQLSEEFDIFVIFERNSDKNRNKDWFIHDLGFNGVILDSNDALEKYNMELKALKSYDAVLVYDYSTVSSIKLMLKCLQLKVPYLINCDGALIKKRHIIKDVIKEFFISRAKACLASGNHAENYFLSYGAKKENIFIHNFSNLYKEDVLDETILNEEKKQIKEKLGFPIDKKIVLSVGRFTYIKGFDILLKSWNLINNHAQLIIVGGGEKEQEYRHLIKEYKIENVTIDGFKPRATLFDYYKASDLFVLPTRGDVWGLVINEAMACGLPVITTNKCVAGLELIENYKNGFIVENEDYKELSEKMIYILENDEMCLSMGRENLNKIRPYIIENVSDSHINTFKLILGDS